MKPYVVESDLNLFVDIDNTLVSVRTRETVPLDWQEESSIPGTYWLKINELEYWLVYEKHIDFLKRSKLRQHNIIIWSAGGHAWAKRVVDTLELNDYVDVIMCKPRWYLDDLPASEFMNECNRIYKYKVPTE